MSSASSIKTEAQSIANTAGSIRYRLRSGGANALPDITDCLSRLASCVCNLAEQVSELAAEVNRVKR